MDLRRVGLRPALVMIKEMAQVIGLFMIIREVLFIKRKIILEYW